MRRQRKKSGQTAPTTSRAEAELQECIKLKEATKNRLKLTHPPESRAAKTTSEIFKILDLQPLPRKPKIKPFSDRITNPFYDFSDKPRSPPPEKPRMPLQAALDFVKRQTEWLSHKNLHEAEDSSPLDALNLEEVCDDSLWSLTSLLVPIPAGRFQEELEASIPRQPEVSSQGRESEHCSRGDFSALFLSSPLINCSRRNSKGKSMRLKC
jgi:hypothetical protein